VTWRFFWSREGFQIWSCPFPLTAAASLPFGLKVTQYTCDLARLSKSAFRFAVSIDFSTSQTRTEKSSPPETMTFPSGWNATAPTGFSCPLREVFNFPVFGSQTWISFPAVDAIHLPSFDHAAERTGSFDPR